MNIIIGYTLIFIGVLMVAYGAYGLAKYLNNRHDQ